MEGGGVGNQRELQMPTNSLFPRVRAGLTSVGFRRGGGRPSCLRVPELSAGRRRRQSWHTSVVLVDRRRTEHNVRRASEVEGHSQRRALNGVGTLEVTLGVGPWRGEALLVSRLTMRSRLDVRREPLASRR
jgi:hypothetical protein